LFEVAIVGGGPTGSRVAYKLAEMGHDVVVLEKRPQIGQKPCCTGIISQECINRFGIPPQVIFRPANSAKIFSPSGEHIRVFKPQTQAGIVNRPDFDNYLADQARSKGAEYSLGSRVEGIRLAPGRVVLDVESRTERHPVEAQALILASGFSSPLVPKVGLKQPGYFVAGAQIEAEFTGIEEVEVYLDQRLAPGFFAWLVPTSPGRGLAGLLSRSSPGFHLKGWLAQLREKHRINPGQNIVRYGGIPLQPLSRTYGERFMVVGDAAGQVKPTTGGGIYFGLLCADIAAETLHNALIVGNLSARGLSLYEREWKARLQNELRMEYFARRLYEHLSDKRIEGIFSRIKSDGMIDSFLQKNEVSFDWHGGLLLKVLKAGAMHEINKITRWRKEE
jgi:digeranylgeranylglycerophospholipid reductase